MTTASNNHNKSRQHIWVDIIFGVVILALIWFGWQSLQQSLSIIIGYAAYQLTGKDLSPGIADGIAFSIMCWLLAALGEITGIVILGLLVRRVARAISALRAGNK